MSWTALKPWLLMALIFGVGMVAGASLMIVFRPDVPHGPPGIQQLRAHWMVHLVRRLDLTPQQQAQIQPILDDAVTRIQKLHRDEVDQFARIMDDASTKISALLTPQQQTELKQLEEERRHAFSNHLGPWGGPRPPGPFPRGEEEGGPPR